MRRFLLSPVALLLGGALAAQAHMPPPPPPPQQPPQHLPLIPPPVDHPAYAAQPLMNPSGPASATPTAPKGGMNEPEKSPAEAAAEEFRKKQVKGAELKKAVDKLLKGLHWYDKLADAKAVAAAAGKPVLWIQALGDVNGFT